METTRREFMAIGIAAVAVSTGAAAASPDSGQGLDIPVLDPIRSQHVMDIVIVTDQPSRAAPEASVAGPDGSLSSDWSIVGGRFKGQGNIRGHVIPGNAYSPVVRPDGVTVNEALFRLKTDDGYQVIVHDKGLLVGGSAHSVPRFIVNNGPHDWLNKATFFCVTSDQVPEDWRMARDGQLERFMQVFKLI